MIEDLLAKRLIFVTGKGGVGKSAVAATLAWKLSQNGKETCLIQLNHEGRLPQYFGKRNFTHDPLLLASHLYGMGIDARQALREYVMQHIHFKLFYELVFENRIMHFFLDAAPGVEDLAVMGKIWTMIEKREKNTPRFDILVIDCPAFGHAQLFLQVAQVIQSMVPVGPVRQNAEKIQKLLNDRKKTA